METMSSFADVIGIVLFHSFSQGALLCLYLPAK
jgi:hypothetical protein